MTKTKKLSCGCYHERGRYPIWTFFPVCERHKKEVEAEWQARPFYRKAFVYFQFGLVMVLFIGGVLGAFFIIGGLIYVIVTELIIKNLF